MLFNKRLLCPVNGQEPLFTFHMMAVFNSSLIFLLIGSIPFSQPKIPSFLILEKLFCVLVCRISELPIRDHTELTPACNSGALQQLLDFKFTIKCHLGLTIWNFLTFSKHQTCQLTCILVNYFLITTLQLHSTSLMMQSFHFVLQSFQILCNTYIYPNNRQLVFILATQ